VGSSNTTIKIWNSTSFELISNLFCHSDLIIALAILPNSNIVSGNLDSTIKIWQSEYPYNCFAILTAHTSGVDTLAILPDTNNIVSESSDSTIKIWESEYPYKIIANLFTELILSTFSLTILPNSNSVSGSSTEFHNVLNIWNSTSFQLITKLYGHTDFINALAVLPNTNNTVSGSWDNSVKIWHLKELEYYSNLTEHTDSLNDLVFLNNGDLASCSNDKPLVFGI
jgi:WD40 repeat protein